MQTLQQIIERLTISGQPCTIQAPSLCHTELKQQQLSM